VTAGKGRNRPRKRRHVSVNDAARRATESIARSLQFGSLTLDEVERIVAGYGTTVQRVWNALGKRFNKKLTVETVRGVEIWKIK